MSPHWLTEFTKIVIIENKPLRNVDSLIKDLIYEMEVAHVFEHYIVSSPYGIALDAVAVFSWGFYFLIHNLSGHAVINFKEQDIIPEVIYNILII